MPLITVAAPPEFYEGVFPGKVKDIRGPVTKTKQATGEQFECFEWDFEVDQTAEEDGTILTLDEISSTNTGPKSKAGQWLVALIGPEAAEPGTQFEREDIVGREGMFTIGTNEKTGYPQVNSIAAKQRRKSGASAAAKPAAAPVAAVEDDNDDLPF